MTEFDLALDFLQSYVEASVSAAEDGRPLDDRREFRRHCDGVGVVATPERVELVRDMAGVIKEFLIDVEDDSTHLIPAAALAEGLERYGWRIGFLNEEVGD